MFEGKSTEELFDKISVYIKEIDELCTTANNINNNLKFAMYELKGRLNNCNREQDEE